MWNLDSDAEKLRYKNYCNRFTDTKYWKTTATNLQVQRTVMCWNQTSFQCVGNSAENSVNSFSKKGPKYNKCCSLNFFISCVLCLTRVVVAALVMAVEMEHCDVVHLMCVCVLRQILLYVWNKMLCAQNWIQ